MTVLLWFLFCMYILQFTIDIVRLGRNEYPRHKTEGPEHDVLGVVLSVAMGVWIGILLFGG